MEKLKCTFRPELCHLPSADRPPVVVCGLDRFYELKGLAEQRDVEQKAHEAKVFRHGCTHGPPMGITIPEPRNQRYMWKTLEKMLEPSMRLIYLYRPGR